MLIKRAAALLVAMACLFCLCACPGGGVENNALTLSRTAPNTYRCEETGVTYVRAADTYLPARMTRAPYATYTDQSGAVTSYFKLGPDSAQNYLVQADPTDFYPGSFLVAEGYDMPTLAEMDPDEIWICGADSEVFWAEANVYSKMLYSDRVDAVVAAYEENWICDALPSGVPEVCVQLIFRSPFYTEFYYYCTYYSFGEGKSFLYEFETMRCLRVPDDLFVGYPLAPDGT